MINSDAFNPELGTILIGGAPCTPDTISFLREKGIDVYIGYGLTETASGIAITQDQDEPFALYPCPDSDISIEADGEVTVETSCMMEGYIGAIPMFDGDRFFTGDIGSVDEQGRLHLTGRKKDVLLLEDGSKIFCPEYEEDIAEKTGFDDLAIIKKDGHAVLIAGSGGDRDTLLAAVNEYNGDRQRSQQIFDVMILEHRLPRTATGKIKRYELQEELGE
jgi:long-subunit acyl-CoA synthetase (AMP-forming)